MVRLVLFDIDGTLIRTGGAGVHAFGKAIEMEFGVRNATARLNFSGRTDYAVFAEFLDQHNLESDCASTERFFAIYLQWLEHYLKQIQGEVCPGVRQFIRQISSHTRAPLVGLLTGNIRLGAELKLRQYSLWNEFRMGAFGDDHADRDQLAHIARTRAAGMLGADLHGDEILVIGDTPLDIKCARAIGARVLAVATGNVPRETLQQHHPDCLLDDLTQCSIWTLLSD